MAKIKRAKAGKGKKKARALKTRKVKKNSKRSKGTIRGRGAYKTVPKSQGSDSSWAGIGKNIGTGVGGFFSKIFGGGAYTVKNNTICSDAGPPVWSDDGSVVLKHREFIQDISGSVAFTLQSFFINPGLFATAPWMSAIANNFEQYDPMGWVWEFKSTSANALNSTNTALGVVIMSTNYDTLDSNFGSKQQMEAYQYTTSCKPSDSMIHPIECSPRLNALSNMYIRTGSVPVGADQRFYDLGNFQIATVGMQAAAVIGELWISYHVKLLKPKLPTPLGANLLSLHLRESPALTASAASPFGTTNGTSSIVAGSTMPTVVSGSTFTMPIVGRWAIFATWSVAVTAIPIFSIGANITALSVFGDGLITNKSAVSTSTTVICFVFDVTSPGTAAANLVTVTGLNNLASGTGDLFVMQISSGLTYASKLRETLDARLERFEAMFARLESGSSLSSRELLEPVSPEVKDYVVMRDDRYNAPLDKTPFGRVR